MLRRLENFSQQDIGISAGTGNIYSLLVVPLKGKEYKPGFNSPVLYPPLGGGKKGIGKLIISGTYIFLFYILPKGKKGN